MIATIEIAGRTYTADFENAHDISIPLIFDGPQPSAFGARPARRRPYELENDTMSTAKGGSCNVDVVTVIPHCNGTHTECVGHIVDDGVSVASVLRPGLIMGALVTVEPRPAGETNESYLPDLRPADRIVSKSGLREACRDVIADIEALVIRTLPNDESKVSRDYDRAPGPFFSTEAIEYLSQTNLLHLLVDFASIDRADDEGRMENHHRFWDVPPGERSLSAGHISNRTVTEFIFVPDSLPDGLYLVDLQVAPFESDAAPSRPALIGLTENG